MIDPIPAGAKLEDYAGNTAWMNELIRAVNRMEKITITPTGVGNVQAGDDNIVITLNTDTCS